MKPLRLLSLLFLTLVSCTETSVRNFWDSRSIDYSDIRTAEDQFADFAELAVAAPEADALAALDVLFDKLKQDTVACYLYAEWVDMAFYSPVSPCRNAALYSKAVDRMVEDGVLTLSDCEPFLQKRDWILYNVEGGKATVPGISSFDTRTLVLVLDLSCPSCREALEKLAAAPEWSGLPKIAVCLGQGPRPTVPGWEYLFPEQGSAVFDIQLTPIYFIIAADGTVERGYALAK